MYGWRARIGVLVPSTNTVVESEFNLMAPEGVSIHAARMKLTVTNPETLVDMEKHAKRASDEIATAGVAVIVYACTSGSFVGGSQWEKDLVKNIEDNTGIKTVTTAGSIIEGLKAVGAKNIVMATPYKQELNVCEVNFLESKGFNVLAEKGLGIDENIKVGSLTPQVAYNLCKSIFVKEADAILISCTDFRTIEIIDILEEDFGVPVITSNQVSMWAALRKAGIGEPIPGLGKIMDL